MNKIFQLKIFQLYVTYIGVFFMWVFSGLYIQSYLIPAVFTLLFVWFDFVNVIEKKVKQ